MSKKALPVIIITVCLLFAGCKAPADQEQKSNTETAVLSTETQEEDWKQVHSTQKDLEKLPQKIQKIFSDNQTFFDVEKGKEYDKDSFIKALTKEGYRPQWAEFLVADWDNDGEYELAVYIKNSPDYNDCRIFDASNKKVYAHAFTARAIEESVIWELSEVQAVQLIQTMTDCFWMEKNKNFMNIKGKRYIYR